MSDATLKRILLQPKDGKLRWKCESCGAMVVCEEKWEGEASECPSCLKSVTYPTRAEVDSFLKQNRYRFRMELGVSLVTAAIYAFGINLPGVGATLLAGVLGWFAAAIIAVPIAFVVSRFFEGPHRGVAFSSVYCVAILSTALWWAFSL